MKIRILGTRGEIDTTAPRHRYHSGILIDEKILFDLGEPQFLAINPSCIFITHLHPDHAFFVTRPFPVGPPVYAPEPFRDSVTVTALRGPLTTGPYVITPIPTLHSNRVHSSAYLVTKSSESVLYTGDMIRIDEKYQHLIKKVDLVITDGSYFRKGGMVRRDPKTGAPFGHAGIHELISLFSSCTKHILFVHFGSWFYKDVRAARRKLKRVGRESGVTVHVGYDGMELGTENLRDGS
jgi:ribonuclease BN (tRNA processing enzyme)